MTAALGVIEDHVLMDWAKEVVPNGGSDVTNAQISGLLSAVRASQSYDVLRRMTQHQVSKTQKEGERGINRLAFFDRLFKALKKVEQLASDYVQETINEENAKVLKDHKKRLSNRFAVTLMTHVAAEHQWQGRSK